MEASGNESNAMNNDSSCINSRNKHKCQNESRESLGISQSEIGTDNLNVDKLLELFEGSQDNLDYFLSLWNVVTKSTMEEKEHAIDDDEEFYIMKHNCDPRDERKKMSIKDWEPTITVVPVGECNARGDQRNTDEFLYGVDVNSVAVPLPSSKQTVFECEIKGDDADGGYIGTDMVGGMEGMAQQGDSESFPCGVHGCGQVLSSLAKYEAHYHHCHSYVCDVCRRQFVSNFLLDIHLQENHDSYFAVLSPRIDMYVCLVESCEKKFRTPELRKDHLVSIHKFPSNFSFHQPVKASRSRQQRQGSSTANGVEGENGTRQEGHESNEMEVESTQSQRKKVPASICFGRGSQKAFQPRRGGGRGGRGRGNKKKGLNWYQQANGDGSAGEKMVDIESVDMKELLNALS